MQENQAARDKLQNTVTPMRNQWKNKAMLSLRQASLCLSHAHGELHLYRDDVKDVPGAHTRVIKHIKDIEDLVTVAEDIVRLLREEA